MTRNPQKELEIRISMLEAKVDLLLSMFDKEHHTDSIEQSVLEDIAQQEIANEIHNDLLNLTS